MKTYYYTVPSNPIFVSWDEEVQCKVEFTSWNKFIQFCEHLSKHFNRVVRACETPGYNNQGHYIWAGNDTKIR